MTRFNPDADLVSIEQWEEIAERKASDTGVAWRIIGGILAGGVGFAASVPALGIVVGGYLCYSAYERFLKSDKDIKAVRDFGCIAHVLDEQEFRSFAKQFGDKEVYDQISFALDRNWEVSKFALNWLNTYERGQQLKPSWKQDNRTIASSPTQEVRQLQRNWNASPQVEIPPIKTNVSTYNPYADSQIDIVAEMTDRVQNIFGVGQGGSGKGMLLANACRAVKAKHPGKKIFLINGKDDPKEHDYFTGCVDVEKPLHCETAKPATVAAWFEAAIAEYDDYAVKNNGALLVIDEGTIIGARLKDAKSNALNDKIIGITSCGGSTGKNVWVFAQTPFAGAGGTNLTALSQMIKVVIVRGDAIGVLDEWRRASIFKKFNSDEVADLAANSECNRAVYWGGSASWYSMPKLTNYSAYDRDSGTFIKDVLTPVEKLEQSLAISETPTTILDDSNTDEDNELSGIAYLVFTIVKASRNEYISFDSIRKSKRWGEDNKITFDALREVLEELLNAAKIEGDEKRGYRII